MSSFKRTLRGIGNQHLFYNVDLVVFLEGGSVSYNKADVYAGKFTAETEDLIFWRNIFNKFFIHKKIKFKSIGSKNTTKEIAIDIINGQLETVYVAMDNEFDEILNKRMKHSNIFYTHGYSWENDIWNQNLIKEVITELTAVEIDNIDIEMNFSKFLKNLKIAVYADGYLFKKGTSFFPRKGGYLFCVDFNSIDLPTIKQLEISNLLQSKNLNKSTLYNFGCRNSIDTLKFCYGHLLADYCYQLITHYIKNRHSLSRISKEIIFRMGLKKFFDNHFDNGHIFNYYHGQFKKNGLL